MRDPLRGIRLKLDRAQKQLGTLEGEIAGFLNPQTYRFSPNYDLKTREFTITARVLKQPSDMWGVQIGEIAHNLRSALDHLVWQLVIAETGNPPTSNKTQFPIFETQSAYNQRSEPTIFGVSPQARTLIEAAQPFATGEGCQSPLYRLHGLSNFDKHRTFSFTYGLVEAAEIRVSGLRPGVGYRIEPTPPGPLKHGTVIARVWFTRSWPFVGPPHQVTKHVKVDGPMRIGIVFDQGCVEVAGTLVVSVLGGIGRRVYETIERISRDILGVELSI